MATTIILYLLFLVIFLIISGLIFRHTVKYSYLSPRFKYIVGFFSIIALAVIIFSIYLLSQMNGTGRTTDVYKSTPKAPSTNTGDLSF